MKWAIIDIGYQPYGGGGNWAYIREFSKALVKNNEEVHIISATNNRNLAGIHKHEGVNVHCIYTNSIASGPLRYKMKKETTDRKSVV